MNKDNKRFEVLVALSIIFSALFLGFFKEFNNLSSLLFAPGDGAKNYFTYLYHIVHDPTFWRFDGMHYPFGENVIFTDNQSLLANLVKLMHQQVPLNTSQLIFIHNLVLFLGTGFGGFGIYLTLKKLNTGHWFALFCSVGLLFIQPQLQRFQSHYSMVYPVLPWIFYFLLFIWEEKNTWVNATIIGVLNVIFGLTHMYHFLTISIVSSLGIGLNFIEKPSSQQFKKSLGWLSLMVFLPLVVLLFMTGNIEPEIDRPQKVWGFFSYHSSWEGLFFNYRLPLYQFVNSYIAEIRYLDPVEAFNYIGLVSVLFTLTFIGKNIFEWRKMVVKLKSSLTKTGKLAWIFVISAFLSFGWPFAIHGLEGLLDYAGPYQQFRGIARLGWISFYAINFISIPYLYQWLLTKNTWIKYGLFAIIPGILLWEGWLLKPNLENPPHLANAYKTSPPSLPFQLNEYQCLIPDPYLHAGSEAFNWQPVGLNQDQFFEVGYALGLPSMATILSRTSLRQSALLNELVCQPYKVPEIIQILKENDKRPILVLESKLDLYNRNSSISHWTQGTEVVYEHPEYRLRKLPLDHFDAMVRQFKDSLSRHPIDTLLTWPLVFEHMYKEKEWGYEAIKYCDSLTRGEVVFSLDIKIKENKDVNAIIEVWQITKDHQNAENFSVRSNYHYKKLSPTQMHVELPLFIKPETDKVAIRLYKDNQKKKDEILFWNTRLFKLKK